MHKEGHIGIGFLLYSPIAYLLIENNLTTVFGLGLVGIGFWSFAPDIDLELPIPHRGPTHSFVAAGVAGVFTTLVALYLAATGIGSHSDFIIQSPTLAYLGAASFGFGIGALGVLGHLLGDVITPMGLRPWWPYSERHHSLNLILAKDENANRSLSFLGALAVTAAMVTPTLL